MQYDKKIYFNHIMFIICITGCKDTVSDIKNKSLDKYIDLQTFEVKDFTDSVKGNWIVFQET